MLIYSPFVCHSVGYMQMLCVQSNGQECVPCGKNDGIKWSGCTLLTCTCVGIHPRRVEPASPIALTTSRTEALQARRSCASSVDSFIQSFVWPNARGQESGSRPALIVIVHVFSWSPVRLRHVRGGVARRRSLISSPSGRLNQYLHTRNCDI